MTEKKPKKAKEVQNIEESAPKSKKAEKQKSIEETLWDSANKLRGSVESAEYKHVVLGLIFLKFASDKFEEHRKAMIAKGQEKYIEMPDFYGQANVFFLDEFSRWSFIIQHSKQNDIALKIDTALHNIEKNNKALKGALPDNYFSRLGLDITKLSSLLDTINQIDTLKDKSHDIVGRVYEYFLLKFALAEGKGKGEFYTPKSIVNLIAEMIEPYRGIIYDPACGSGGMFVQSIKFIESHHGNKKEVSIYGQESINTTYKLAKMNLAIRGISANLGDKAADTFSDDQHKDLKADFIMANPPFNQKDWRGEKELLTDPRWRGYDAPPKSNANYAWILNMVSKMSENGVAGFLLANGSLSGAGEEYKIRRKLVENNLVEAIIVMPRNLFYTTDISVTLWILNKNKKEHARTIGDVKRHYRNREREILFMDLRQIGEPFEKKYVQFNEQHIKQIAATYHAWQTEPPVPLKGVEAPWLAEGGVLDDDAVPVKGAGPSVLYSANPKLYRQLEEKALEMRKNPTKAESVLWDFLRNNKLGVKFRQQHVIDQFIADFCSIKEALIIEVDGDSHDSRKEADEERTNILKSYGYKIIRFNNDQIINDLDSVLETIKSEIKNNQKSPEAPMSPEGDESFLEAPESHEVDNSIEDLEYFGNSGDKSPLGDLGAQEDSGAYKDIPEYCYSATIDEVAKKDFSLVPSKYIEFVNRDENIDFDEKMKDLQGEFNELLKAEAASRKDLLKVFKELGYEIRL